MDHSDNSLLPDNTYLTYSQDMDLNESVILKHVPVLHNDLQDEKTNIEEKCSKRIIANEFDAGIYKKKQNIINDLKKRESDLKRRRELLQKELAKHSFTSIVKRSTSKISPVQVSEDLLRETASSAMKKREKSSDLTNRAVLVLGKNSNYYYVPNTYGQSEQRLHSEANHKLNINPISRKIVKHRNDPQKQYIKSIGAQLESFIRNIGKDEMDYEDLCALLTNIKGGDHRSVEIEEVAGELWNLLKPKDGYTSNANVYDLLLIFLSIKVLNDKTINELLNEYFKKQELKFDDEGIYKFEIRRA